MGAWIPVCIPFHSVFCFFFVEFLLLCLIVAVILKEAMPPPGKGKGKKKKGKKDGNLKVRGGKK